VVNYAGRQVLVTGATGFIGARLAERLAFEEKASVRALVRDMRKSVWLSRSPMELVVGDVTEKLSLEKAVAGCDIVFHCVGIGGSSETCKAVNTEGTRNVLEAAQAAGVKRLVYLSSVAVYGPSLPDHADETAPSVRTGASYGDSKVEAEELISRFVLDHSMTVIVLQPTFVWGPRSEWFTVDPIRQMAAGAWQLVDEGQGTCHAVYVDNLVDAIMLAGLRPSLKSGEKFLVTDDQPCTWGEFWLAHARMVGKSSLPSFPSTRTAKHPIRLLDRWLWKFRDWLGDHCPDTGPFRYVVLAPRYVIRKGTALLRVKTIYSDWDLIKYARRYNVDIAKAKMQLGYNPKVSRADGMQEIERWLRDQRIIS
jgi:nucleoside-diphosphate-sugar epimerase